jgi:YHS domain-containing protein
MVRINRNFWLTVLAVFIGLAVAASPLVLRAGDEVKDPVCNMKVDTAKAQFKSAYEGKTYYFCSADCKAKFDANPGQYVKKEEASTAPHKHMMPMEHKEMAQCEHGEGGCCAIMKDVKREVTNLPDGIQVKITSDKPEVVKKLQEMHKEGKGCCAKKHSGKDCPMMKQK